MQLQTNETIRGKEYDIPTELLGFLEQDLLQIYPLETINFAIANFNEAERNQRKLITENMFTGDLLTIKILY